jgi:hypothetical protein
VHRGAVLRCSLMGQRRDDQRRVEVEHQVRSPSRIDRTSPAAFCACAGMAAVKAWSAARSTRLRGLAAAVSRATACRAG